MGETVIETIELGRDFIQHRRLFQRQSVERITALEDVSFSIQRGRCLAIVGPNGAGKSTLLRILATTLTPSRGAAYVAGLDVERQSSSVRGHVGYAGNADRSFFWPLTGVENLVFFSQLAGASRPDAVSAARLAIIRVGLDHAADNRVGGYSAGMPKRLALARALIHDPAVLLLDEPTSNLDAEYREIAVEIINGAVADGCTAIIATHDPGLVSATATDRMKLVNGQMVPPVEKSNAVRYVIQFRSVSAELGLPEVLEVDDLGDGHVLSAELNRAIADGRDIVSVEQRDA